jgi:Zn finger protein HypA/HybF involved in hydrogenase expression
MTEEESPPRRVTQIVTVACPRCRSEALHVTDGPGLLLSQPLGPDEATRPGDVGGCCPQCGERVYVRLLRPAA